ncbi:primosomal protein N' (replication factor Y) - superfamily II helicase [Falsihalocynthiibacter sp. S25ZX9]|uniref:primosomal protein N' (replication factor Y) - superfamily II helicase n=1 Tax=Falsihalocynthiibacter sp. S25ZX9 TaxID=3240870 RepID=UPI003510A23C
MNTIENTPQEEHLFPCENCGADLRFSPKTGVLTCNQCGFREGRVEPKTTIPELDFKSALADALPSAEIEENRVTSCPNCGAQVGFDGENHASECPFCATPVVVDTGSHRQIKPSAVLPFQLDETTAHDAMSTWLGRLWFAPNGLKAYARKGRRMQGIYVPYWTFDADTKSRYRGQRGTEYQTTSTHFENGKKVQRNVTKVRWTPVSGRVSRLFDDVLVLASKALPTRYTQALEPWDLSGLEPFQAFYLAGFKAEGYSIDLENGFSFAREKMDRQILRDVKFDIGGDRQQVGAIETSVSDVTFKHILLPVWLAAYKYQGKTYRFVVNGQTGRVEGERPYSAWKIGFSVLLALGLAAVFGYFYAQST